MSLVETKRQLSRRYIGRSGIHAIGLARAQNAIRVYLSAPTTGETDEQRTTLRSLERDALPYPVLLTIEEPATFA
ncbi:hypothetical protein [Methylobacterium oryzisoli]|uniref:hypothetical protein n=1 Tax=Methylobacterium oryzisoli TaxID=3385502 RepID=UPI00389131FF